MKLTVEQSEKAIGLRELLKSEPPEAGWENYLDFTRAVAQMLDGLDAFVRPTEMKRTFDLAWKSFCKVWAIENERVVLEAIGDSEMVDQVRSHPNGQNMCARILARVKEKNDGVVSLGIKASDVDVSDILMEGLSDGDPSEYN